MLPVSRENMRQDNINVFIVDLLIHENNMKRLLFLFYLIAFLDY